MVQTPTEAILRVEGLSKTYTSGNRSLTVLEDINFAVDGGGTCAIVGASGSGKTTLLGLCAGLDRASAGSVQLDGVRLEGLDEDQRARLRNERVGFVFQNFQLIPTLTALENVMVPLELRQDRAAGKEATQMLARVGLEDRLDHYPVQLSGGEQQRVALARAFVNRPKILFADEPTGNLDAETSHTVEALLFSLNQEAGTTLVLVTHDLELAQQTQRVIRLKGGRVISDTVSIDGVWTGRMNLWGGRWIVLMAWRDSRSFKRRLVLFTGSIAVGIAALVAIGSLAVAMERSVDAQANALLGADMAIHSRRPFPPAALTLFDSLGGQQARQVHFPSMVLFPKNQHTRLTQVRALEGAFPFYGAFQTEPADAATRLGAGGAYALVDEGLMIQLDVAVGDVVKIGAVVFEIAGRLQKIPGETAALGSLEPRIYIPMEYLEQTRLVQVGSRVEYYAFFKFPHELNRVELAASLEAQMRQYHLDLETVESRKRQLGRSLNNLYRFLNLGSFIALVLGSVGVASAVHAYIKQKLGTVAILRSLGATATQTCAIYLLQALGMGLVGAMAGVLGGAGILSLVPWAVGGLLPVDAELGLAAGPALEGAGIGLGMALLFAGLPLLAVRRVSPLWALRSSYEVDGDAPRDYWRWVFYAAIVGALGLFALQHTRQWQHGVGVVAGLGGAFGVLSLAGWGLTRAVRRFFPRSWGYVWRQGLANLYRPHNQTLTLILALGLGTFLIATLYLLQTSLLKNIATLSGDQQPNIVLFDIQSDQLEDVTDLVDSFGLPIIEQVPVVAMRLARVNGRDIEDIRQDTLLQAEEWALAREYRSTYRDYLTESETVVAGQWHGRVSASEDSVFISMDQSLAANLALDVGGELVFDVQGVPIVTYIGSLRSVDWKRIRPNFLLVFPSGVLEAAPQFHVLVSRTDSTELSARLQRQAVQRFPNVSIIDLDLVLTTAGNILDKVALVIRFMALFSVATGLLVLLGVVTSSRFQRGRESTLLKTLGASRAQVRGIMVLEYFFLGFLAALNGALLALVGAWALSTFVFDVPFEPALTPLVSVVVLVSCATVLVGMLTSQGIAERSPLEALRTVG